MICINTLPDMPANNVVFVQDNYKLLQMWVSVPANYYMTAVFKKIVIYLKMRKIVENGRNKEQP